MPTPVGPVPPDPDDPEQWDWDADDDDVRPGHPIFRLVVVILIVLGLVLLLFASVL